MKNREEWLCDQLDNDSLSDALRIKYEKELDAMAEKHSKAQIRLKEIEAEAKIKREELKARILAKDFDFIKSYGEEEFGSDYDVVQEGDQFVIYSKVARDDQEHRRVHATLEAANADLRYLFYCRLYTKYIRPGDMSSLIDLVS